MKQILQNLKDGSTEIAEVPCPRLAPGHLLLRTTRTLISAGTERMLVDFGKANPLEKARQQPDKVRQVLEKVKTDGLAPTLAAVRNKLEQPLPLGYCHVGVVAAVGGGRQLADAGALPPSPRVGEGRGAGGQSGFAVGDRVISNGKHAEMVSVPVNLCARIPDNVSDEAAAFTVIGAIALQGIRLVAPTLGEAVVVTGLGLIGLLTVQLLRAQGCRVLGIDLDPAKLALARRFGAETVDLAAGQDPVAVATAFSRGRGVDAVLITAASRSNEPVHQAAQMCRQRGRIVLVGVVGLELSRADFYEKELIFQVSCSYGPGRYDPRYEAQGLDYPIGFVRWTEQRNFEAVLDMLADGRLDVAPLVSHRFALAEAQRAYEVVAGAEPSLGIVLEYPGGEAERLLERTVVLDDARGEAARGGAVAGTSTRVGAEGAGSARGESGASGGGEVPSLALGPGFPAGTTEASRGTTEASRHSGREAGIQAREGNLAATSTPTPTPSTLTPSTPTLTSRSTPTPTPTPTPAVSFIGAGNYATGVLIPAFKAAGAVLRTVASSGGVSGVHAGRKFGFAQTTTDTEALLTDAGTTALVITTRHDSHARWVTRGLAAGKAVFVEKPLCLTLEELAEIAAVAGLAEMAAVAGLAEMAAVAGLAQIAREVAPVVPAGKPGPSAREGESAGNTEAPELGVRLPSMALDSGIQAGMTEKTAGMTEKTAGMTEKTAGTTEKTAGMTDHPLLMVGFNRRFAPQVQKIKALLAGVTGPKALVMTVNAGAIPADHWTQDPAVGGGRIIGEACHFIDLLRFLAGAPIARAEAVAMDAPTRDSVSINLHFADGSLGTILYLTNGSKAFPKERLEVFAAGRVLQLDNFRKLTGFGWPGFKKLNLWRQDKGQQACAAAFVQALRARAAGQAAPPPIPLDEILEVSRMTIEVAQS